MSTRSGAGCDPQFESSPKRQIYHDWATRAPNRLCGQLTVTDRYVTRAPKWFRNRLQGLASHGRRLAARKAINARVCTPGSGCRAFLASPVQQVSPSQTSRTARSRRNPARLSNHEENAIKAVRQMAEGSYSFAPVTGLPTSGELIEHIASVQSTFRSNINGDHPVKAAANKMVQTRPTSDQAKGAI